jgi:hydrogenase expression/formation protein HypC
MCLAIPGLLESVRVQDGLLVGSVRFGGLVRDAVLEHVPQAKKGDYVLVHVGFALQILDEAEAKRTYDLLEQIGAVREELEPGT